MRNGAIFSVFFILFTLATLAVPIPLFPGNMVQTVASSIGLPVFCTQLLNALANGMLYGFLIWTVYFLISRKLEEPEVDITSRKKGTHKKKSQVATPVERFPRNKNS